MEKRIEALEAANLETRDRLARIETRMDTLATKEDLAETRAGLYKAISDQTWKVIGSCALLATAVFYIARHVH